MAPVSPLSDFNFCQVSGYKVIFYYFFTYISLMTSRSKHFNLFHIYGLRGFPSFANYPHIFLPLFSIELFTFSY